MTYGQKAVGLTFNPSDDSTVLRIKDLYAEIIDLCHEAREAAKVGPSLNAGEKGRLFSVAITEAQTAQMWAVKAATWRD